MFGWKLFVFGGSKEFLGFWSINYSNNSIFQSVITILIFLFLVIIKVIYHEKQLDILEVKGLLESQWVENPLYLGKTYIFTCAHGSKYIPSKTLIILFASVHSVVLTLNPYKCFETTRLKVNELPLFSNSKLLLFIVLFSKFFLQVGLFISIRFTLQSKLTFILSLWKICRSSTQVKYSFSIFTY